jgi:RNA-directed DNA polymerase
MPGGRASDSSIGPMKRPHKVAGHTTMRRRAQAAAAEAVEGRARAKGKLGAHPRGRTQRRRARPRALDRRRQAARRDHAQPWTARWHHVYESHRLRAASDGLHHDAAPGVDGQTWAAYRETLAAHLQDLSDRLQHGGSPARPVARVSSPQPAGRQRPLGLPPLEDKSVPRATVAVLHALSEGVLRGFAYGCRPGRSPPAALDAVPVGLEQRPGNWGREADLRGFFEAIDHAGLLQCIAQRLGDQRVLRHRQKGRHAGVLAEGQGHAQEEGPPHGGRGSPVAAPMYLPDVRDVGAERWRRHHARGEGIIVRYADDGMVGVAHRDDAERFGRELQERLGKFNRVLPPEKTRRIEGGRCAVERRPRRAQGKPEPFALLGWTQTCRKTSNGQCAVRRKPRAQRFRKKLQAVQETLRRRRHWPSPPQGAWLHSVLLGPYRYDAVPRKGSLRTVCRDAILRYWGQTLRRRRQRHRLPWPRMAALAEHGLPQPPTLHPYPAQRLGVTTRGRSPVR